MELFVKWTHNLMFLNILLQKKQYLTIRVFFVNACQKETREDAYQLCVSMG
jgi:hypothetical protein